MQEIWKPVPSFPKYEASSLGRVRRIGAKKPITPHLDSRGYLSGKISGTARRLHRLICEAFNGPAPNPDTLVRHLDGIKTNINPSNLAWGTHLENLADRTLHSFAGSGYGGWSAGLL